MQGIYKIINKVNGRYYVGSSRNVEIRWKEHCKMLGSGNHHCVYLQRAWDKYGADSFLFSFVECCELRELRQREQEYLDSVISDRILYNTSFNAMGPGHEGYVPWNKGKKCKPVPREVRDKISKTVTELWESGVYDGVGEKVRQALMGRKYSEERRRAISEGQKGREPWNKGVPRSEVCREKLRIISAKWHHSHESPVAKPYPAFYNENTGECIPEGVNLARVCREYGLSAGAMGALRRGDRQQTKGGWRVA